ncbi:tyrosine-type recombinase/integrase [Methanolobus halotolerans]|nr:site-specific integrase [Methanolobus halotolerans]
MVPYEKNALLLKEETDYLTLYEFRQLLDALETRYTNLQRKSIRNLFIKERNKLLLEMMWITAGRISDVLSIRAEDIDFNARTIKFYVQKRKKWHRLSIDSDIALRISNYIRIYRVTGFIFKGFGQDKNKVITRQYVHQMLQELAEIAGIRPIHAHLFRHGLATFLLSKGVPLEVISYRLAHSSTKVTADYYARITPDIERDLLKSYVPNLLGHEV